MLRPVSYCVAPVGSWQANSLIPSIYLFSFAYLQADPLSLTFDNINPPISEDTQMNPVPVNFDRLSDPRVAAHIETVDSRVRGGFRLALDVLGIPLPEYAKTKPAGRPSIAKLMAAADADSGTNRTYRDEKLGLRAFASRR